MKLLRRAFWTILTISILGLVFYSALPTMIGCGYCGLAIQVTANDAITHQPIPAATMTLVSSRRTREPGLRVSPSTILTAQTDAKGQATLKDLFGAGFGNSSTSINVGASTVKCLAAGYLPAEVPLAPKGRLKFYEFFGYKQPRSISLSFSLTRKP